MASSNGEAPHRPLRDSDGLSGETSIASLIGRPGVGMDHVPVNHLVHLAATLDSANYFSERMPQARLHDDKFQQLGDALRARGRDGLIAEFGVFEGATINFIAGQTEEPVFGFDCFSGLPEDWRPGFPQGMFSARIPPVRPNVSLLVGLFEDTLPTFLEQNTEDLSLLHIDCDLYSSTRTVLRMCSSRIQKGTVLVFDEYFNYPGWRSHEFKAFQEFIADTGRQYEYLSAVPSYQQVAVIITR